MLCDTQYSAVQCSVLLAAAVRLGGFWSLGMVLKDLASSKGMYVRKHRSKGLHGTRGIGTAANEGQQGRRAGGQPSEGILG